MGSIHAIITSSSYKSAVIKTIKAGGCNCSRANFVGAYFSALKGIKNIPTQWINKTKPAKSIIKWYIMIYGFDNNNSSSHNFINC